MDTISSKLMRAALLMSSLCGTLPATASPSYTSNFSQAGLGGVNQGGIYFEQDRAGEQIQQASQTFSGTGLATVSRLQLTLNLGDPAWQSNWRTAPLEFGFFLNGTSIGSTTYLPLDYSPHVLDFNFATLSNTAGDWTLKMAVSQPEYDTCRGCGAVRLSSDNPLLLAIPEPSALALLGLGLALAGYGLSRRTT